MAYELDGGGQLRLNRYFDGIGVLLGRRDRRESFALYALGLFGEGERKSIEPIVARVCGDEEFCNAYHYRLVHFVGVSPWSDEEVRKHATQHGISAMSRRDAVTDWIIDDTGFPKQGDKYALHEPHPRRSGERDRSSSAWTSGQRVGGCS